MTRPAPISNNTVLFKLIFIRTTEEITGSVVPECSDLLAKAKILGKIRLLFLASGLTSVLSSSPV